jgi:integrase/recombinase XerC
VTGTRRAVHRRSFRGVDQAALASLRAGLSVAREAGDTRPPFAIVAECVTDLGVTLPRRTGDFGSLQQAREDWLRRLRSSGRSTSALVAYRVALDDLLAFIDARTDCDPFSEQTVVAHLDEYRARRRPAPATYYRRFTLLRHFYRWLSRRAGVPDPFLDLPTPRKPQQEADWLTPEEFQRLLAAAASPRRNRRGLAERDELVLIILVVTGLRRSELMALNWGDLELDTDRPSLLVRSGKGGRPRRQPLPGVLARQLAAMRDGAPPDAPVFRGLAGGRLQPTILANIIRRAATAAGIEKKVTAHTLRHTAATWLRQQTGDARLVAAYLGHADLSTVSRYAHVAVDELHAAARVIADRAVVASSVRPAA